MTDTRIERNHAFTHAPDKMFCNDKKCYDECTDSTECNTYLSSTKPCYSIDGPYTQMENSSDLSGNDFDKYGCNCYQGAGWGNKVRVCVKETSDDASRI